MNKEGMGKVKALLEKLEELRSEIESVGEKIQMLAEEEREKFDNLPENFQSGPAGERMDEIAGQLEEAVDACESGNIGDAIDALELI